MGWGWDSDGDGGGTRVKRHGVTYGWDSPGHVHSPIEREKSNASHTTVGQQQGSLFTKERVLILFKHALDVRP